MGGKRAPSSHPASRARRILSALSKQHPGAFTELDFRNPFELLVATILSAQCTDKRVNMVTPALFARYRAPEDLAACNPTELEEIIHSTGFFQAKARNLIGMADRLVRYHAGEVPASMRELTALPGVGRKTANVVRSVAFDLPGLPVDTHVGRLSRRLGMTEATDPVAVEKELNPMIPAGERGDFSMRLILHGREVCGARRAECDRCVCNDFCPSAFAV